MSEGRAGKGCLNCLFTLRWEAHIWCKDIGRQVNTQMKGKLTGRPCRLSLPYLCSRRQVYLGGYEKEEHAAEAYDVAVLKVKGLTVGASKINFDAR